MKNLIFTYSDSEAGKQTESFQSLSSIIKHIEDFNPEGDSTGVIYQDNEPIIEYVSADGQLTWRNSQ